MIYKASHYCGQSLAAGSEIFLFINFPSQLPDLISCHLPWSASYVTLGGAQGHEEQHRSLFPSVSSRGISFYKWIMSQVPEYCNDICREIFHCLWSGWVQTGGPIISYFLFRLVCSAPQRHEHNKQESFRLFVNNKERFSARPMSSLFHLYGDFL